MFEISHYVHFGHNDAFGDQRLVDEFSRHLGSGLQFGASPNDGESAPCKTHQRGEIINLCRYLHRWTIFFNGCSKHRNKTGGTRRLEPSDGSGRHVHTLLPANTGRLGHTDTADERDNHYHKCEPLKARGIPVGRHIHVNLFGFQQNSSDGNKLIFISL